MDSKEKQASKPMKNKELNRKPSFKKPPEIKQTLTSMKRMLNANPLLKLDYENKLLDINLTNSSSGNNAIKNNDSSNFSNHKIPVNTKFIPPKTYSYSKNSSMTKSNKFSSNILSGNKPITCETNRPGSSVLNASKNKSNLDFDASNLPSNLLSSTRVQNVSHDTSKNLNSHKSFQKTKSEVAKKSLKPVNKINKKPIRRSLSAQHFDRKKNMQSIVSEKPLNSTQSMEDIRTEKGVSNAPDVSLIEEETSVAFKTPKAYERRSIARFTPLSANRRRTIFTPVSSTPSTPHHKDLQRRLNEWLKKRGKSFGSFNHLKCFGVHSHDTHKQFDEEDKENVEVDQDLGKGSYEDLKIAQPKPTNEIQISEENLEDVAKTALSDLHKLILEGYPKEHCEAWLQLIRQKYNKLEEEPQYWECRAAIEQIRGNISSAVEFYKTAIVQGAEVNSVDKSLDQLLQKFSLLNISASQVDENTDKDRARIVSDARNVFKSSIIQFAVQERKLKKKNQEAVGKKFLATPVRRSTRLSRSTYISTPGVKICDSLHELDTSVRNTMDFRNNTALL